MFDFLFSIKVTAAQELQDMAGPKTPTSAPPVTGQMLDRRKIKERKIGHRRVDEEGQITFKKVTFTPEIFELFKFIFMPVLQRT